MAESIDLALDEPRTPEVAALPPLPKLSGYELIREKGRGPRAVVFKARRLFENDTVAVKLYHPDSCGKALQARLEAGIERTSKLELPGLVRALGFGHEGSRAFLVLEYASGEALSSFLFRRQQFPALKTIALVQHCARTLKSAAAKGLYHGRLHPGAIVLSRNNVRIIGVGMGARPEHAEWPAGKDQSPHVFEPLIYAAPEALPSKPALRQEQASAADIYALGAILFHMLACAPPYKCSDEESLVAERAALKPRHPVVWPVEVFAKLKPEMIELVEAMLAPDPALRPDYDALLARSGALQQALQQAGGKGSDTDARASESGLDSSVEKTVQGAPVVLKKFVAPTDTVKEKRVLKPGVARSKTVLIGDKAKDIDKNKDKEKEKLQSATAAASGERDAATSASQHAARKARVYAPRSTADVVFSTLLFGLTVLVVACVAYVTLQPQLPEKYQLFKGLLAGDGGRVAGGSGDMGKGSPAERAENVAASSEPRQIVVTASPEEYALAGRQMDKIQEMLKNAEVQPSEGLARVLRGIAEKAGVASATGIRASIMAGDMEARSAPGRQGEGISPDLAKALTSAAEAMKSAAKAPSVQAAPSATTVPEVPAVPVKVEKPIEAVKVPPSVPAAVAPLVQARAMMKYFGYAKAKEGVAQFAAKGDTEQKRLAEDFQLTVSYEEGLYERCRAKLVDQIKKNPRHESPLQVFPRKDDPIGDDIVNFDEKGLHIFVRGGPNQGEKVTPWEKAPPAQILNLLAALTAKNNLEDQLGLAAFAFNRGLNLESEEFVTKAQALPGGKEKASALADIFNRLGRAVQAP